MKRKGKRGSGRRAGSFGDGGQMSGYANYRYGENRMNQIGGARPVYIPGKAPPRPIVSADRHMDLVAKTAAILDTFKATKFEHEGACRAGLRTAWCEEGNGWQRSDDAAAKVVADALDKIGARRPSWEEGQWVYAQREEQCAWCQGPIEDGDQSSGRRFCSADCAKSALLHMNRKTNHHYGAVLRSAIRLIDKEKSEARPCRFCATPFKSDRADAQFCSASCAGFHVAGELAFGHIERKCEECNRAFKPNKRDRKFCSTVCAGVYNKRREAESLAHERRCCPHCQSEFTPTIRSQVYCGRDCQTVANRVRLSPAWNEKMKASRAAKRPPRACEWCGEVFTPKMTLAKFCSKRCTADASRHAAGWEPRDITRRVFDRYFTTPFNAAWREAA